MLLTKEHLEWFEYHGSIEIRGIWYTDFEDDVLETTRVLVFPSHIERKKVSEIDIPYNIYEWKSLKKIVIPEGVHLSGRNMLHYSVEIEIK